MQKLSHVIELIENGVDVFEAYKKLSVKDALLFAKFAWDEISNSTIFNCFKKACWINSEKVFEKENESNQEDLYVINENPSNTDTIKYLFINQKYLIHYLKMIF